MVAGNLRLVAKICRRESRRYPRLVLQADYADMLQAGAMGLLRGAEKFDPERGYKFSTFAFYWVWQAVGRWVASDCRTIRLPVAHGDQLAKVYKAIDRLHDRHGRPPTRQELADESGVAAEMIEVRFRTGQPCLSLNHILQSSEDGQEFIDFQQAQDDDHQYEELYDLIDKLSPLQQELIIMNYGLGLKAKHSQKELARANGISVELVRRELAAAHATLQGQEQLNFSTLTQCNE
jgi:RNA polymerase nonessential primary-like sigma factor